MRVLVDTSVWIDHFKRKNSKLAAFLEQNLVVTHSAVLGELACGNIKRRRKILEYLKFLPAAKEASSEEILEMIEYRHLYGKGLNWVDVNLIASSALSNIQLWTKDKKIIDFMSSRH